jgi:hypothetical protein
MYFFQMDLKAAIEASITQIIRNKGLELNNLSNRTPIITPTITPATSSDAISIIGELACFLGDIPNCSSFIFSIFFFLLLLSCYLS